MADESKDLTDWSEPREPRRWPIWVGAIISVAWLAYLVIYRFSTSAQFAALPPNEFGDFLAGAFAPLAFLWLVLGFWQQGQELRHSADALRLQGRELQHSVEQQRELVEVTREQLHFENLKLEEARAELDRSSKPRLHIIATGSTGNPPGKRLHEFKLVNYGQTCTNVKIHVMQQGRTIEVTRLSNEVPAEFRLDIPVQNPLIMINLMISYWDVRQRYDTEEFCLTYDNGTYHSAKVAPINDDTGPDEA